MCVQLRLMEVGGTLHQVGSDFVTCDDGFVASIMAFLIDYDDD